jgi:hypothetical protein
MVLTGGLGFLAFRDSDQTISLSPFLDFFVTNGLSLGGGISYSRTKTSGASSSFQSIGVSFRGGWNVALGSRLSLWPFLLFGISSFSGGQQSTNATVEVPLLIHIVPHFFLAGGVYATSDRPLGNNNFGATSQTETGLTSFLGGWW